MNATLKRLFVASAAIASLSTALLLSGPAQSKPYTANDTVQMEPTNVSPADPDASIRGQGN
jgi:hypothetical protein